VVGVDHLVADLVDDVLGYLPFDVEVLEVSLVKNGFSGFWDVALLCLNGARTRAPPYVCR
jgi:hypothetical protein